MTDHNSISALALEALMNIATDAVVAVNTGSSVVAWNKIAENTFGWTREEAVGSALGDLIIPTRYRQAHLAGMERYHETGVASVINRRIEITAINREGREFPVELSIVTAPPGGEAAFVGFLRDISDRIAAQERLAVSEGSLRLATEAAEVGTWDLDLSTDTLTWSDRTKSMFGISPSTLCSMRDFYEGLHPDDREKTSLAFAAALDPTVRSTYDVEYRTVGKEDGKIRWVAARGKGIFNDEGRCVRAVGTAINITAHKIADAQQQLMLRLSDILRDPDFDAASHDACALLGEHFGVSRVGIGRLDATQNAFTCSICWTDLTVPPLLGIYPSNTLGEKIVAKLDAGQTVSINDLRASQLVDSPALEAANRLDTRAILISPIIRDNRLQIIIYLNDRRARTWSSEDIAFVETFAERLQLVAERAEAEAARFASEAEFKTFAQAMPNHVWACGSDGLLNWFNDRVFAYSGMRLGELEGLGWIRMVHPDDLQMASLRWAGALERGHPYETEFRLRRADGTYRWHLARALPIRNSQGLIIRWIGTNTDIEDAKAATAALATINSDLEQQVAIRTAERDRVWKNSQDLLVVADSEGRFRAVSPSVVKILGWQPDELVGRSLFDFVVPDDQQPTNDAFKSAASGTLGTFENRYVHKDGGYRWLSWVAAPEEGFVYASARNVTTEKEAAVALEKTQEALRQSQKMEAVGNLTGGIAHDFNNMLAIVIGSLDLVKRKAVSADSHILRYIDSAAEGARRAALLTQRLLAFSRQQPLNPQPVNLNKLVTGMSDLLRHSLGAAINVETVLAAGLWQTRVDANQLENVILNLAVNARDAMPGGGHLTIETQNSYLDDRYVAAEIGVKAGQYVLLAVTDTGSGMSPDTISKAFDPFYTTKGVGKGTGLGLSQVYGFIRQSGGHVKIYSEMGHGTTVKVYVPRLLAIETADPEHVLTDIPLGDQGEVILVVEDEEAVRNLSVDALKELGYQVLEANGAAKALELLDRNPSISLLFTDVVMPDINGKKLADEALRRHPDLKVLFTTGYTRNAIVHNGTLDAGVDLIGKPFTLDDLAAKIRHVLDR